MTTIRSVLTVLGFSAFVVVYMAALMLFSISLPAFLLTLGGISPFSTFGLAITAIGSGVYLIFEFYTLSTERGAPVAVIVLAIVLMPWLVLKGVDYLSNEYSRLREIIISLPRSLVSHLLPSGLN